VEGQRPEPLEDFEMHHLVVVPHIVELDIGFGDSAVKMFGEYAPTQHKFGKIDLVTFTPKSKREMFPTLRKAFEAPTKLRIPVSRDIREDLHAMQQVISNGEYNYWAPKTREGHSDRCTALALAVRAAGTIGAGGLFEPKPMGRGNVEEVEIVA